LAWKQARHVCRGKIVVDLSGMTFIESSGQAALLVMITEGTQLTAKGAFNQALAKELMDKARKFVASPEGETEAV
jgi:hypothetical protein